MLDSFNKDNPTTLKIGVIGIGQAGQNHIKSYKKIPNVEIVALAGMEPQTLEKLLKEHDIPNGYSRWENMLKIEKIDAVSLAVPTYLHYPIAIAALESGIHVLSEKPIARNSAEAKEMVIAARKANRVLDVVFNHRYRSDIQRLKQIITSGELGEIYYAKASWTRRAGIPSLGSWFTKKEFAGGGPLIDIGIHILDYALFLLGEPEVLSASAVTYAQLGPRGKGSSNDYSDATSMGTLYEVEDFAAIFMRLAFGKTLILETGWAAYRDRRDKMGLSLYGTEGGAKLSIKMDKDNTKQKLHIYKDKDDLNADYDPQVAQHLGHDKVIENFIEKIRNGPELWAEHDGSLALKRAYIIDACYESANQNKEIEIKYDY